MAHWILAKTQVLALESCPAFRVGQVSVRAQEWKHSAHTTRKRRPVISGPYLPTDQTLIYPSVAWQHYLPVVLHQDEHEDEKQYQSAFIPEF